MRRAIREGISLFPASVADGNLSAIESAQGLGGLWRIAVRMLEDYARGVADCANPGSSRNVRALIRFMRDNYCQDIGLADLARAASLSPNYASSLLKKETGMGLSENLKAIRVEESSKLLLSTALSVKEVAVAVGFSLPNNFYKVFKARTGFSPSEYRRSVSGS